MSEDVIEKIIHGECDLREDTLNEVGYEFDMQIPYAGWLELARAATSPQAEIKEFILTNPLTSEKVVCKISQIRSNDILRLRVESVVNVGKVPA